MVNSPEENASILSNFFSGLVHPEIHMNSSGKAVIPDNISVKVIFVFDGNCNIQQLFSHRLEQV